MSTEQPKNNEEITQLPQASDYVGVNGGRRRFTKASIAASGVIATLATRSSLAAEAISPSGFVSVNQSRHGAHHQSRARTPQYWLSATRWPVGKDTKFNAIFHQCSHSSPYFNVNCADVLAGKLAHGVHAHNDVGAYLVAAYLNATMGWTDEFLTSSQCVIMGNEWLQTGLFRPTANVTWTSAQITHYFQNTQC
ncbi:hypothetical protein [Undibacterium sp. SXout20W]|uniref:hypothetical protein n=1 Tax=Undibacterium sp. SXout20W TaxID=3413051 RepID=UPI003BEFC3D6